MIYTTQLPYKNNAHLKVGDQVICTETVIFLYGEKHVKGEKYTVEPDTQAYFSLFTGTANPCKYLKL